MRIFVTLIVFILSITEAAFSREFEGPSTSRITPASQATLVFERLDQLSLLVSVARQDRITQIDLAASEAIIGSLKARLLDSLRPDLATVVSPADVPTFDVEAAHNLFKLLIQPLISELHGIDRLAITAEGTLSDLPFDVLLTALPSAQAMDAKAYKTYPWLRKTFAITRLTKSTRLRLPAQNASRIKGGLLAFGNPLIADDLSLPTPTLPEANLELALLRMSLHGRPGTIAVGAKASEARFKEALGTTGPLAVLALATHGVRVSGKKDEAVLMLSQGDGEDGYLTAEEVRGLRFRADLVVLSACDSGAETLVDAFIEAGGEQVLALRWPVLSDVARQVSSTVVAMTQNDANLPHDLALWRTLEHLISGASPHLDHPMFWAPFVLTTATA